MFYKRIIIILLTALMLLCFTLYSCKQNNPGVFLDSYDQLVQEYTTVHPIQFLEYGPHVGFRRSLPVKNIPHITYEALTEGSDEYERTVLIVNDENGRIGITDEELDVIMEMVKSGKLDFFYIGTVKQDAIKAYDVPNPDEQEVLIVGEQPRSLAIAFCRFRDIPVFIDNVWTEYDVEQSGQFAAENLQLVILDQLDYYVNEGH